MNILMWLENWDGKVPKPAILKPEPLWTESKCSPCLSRRLAHSHQRVGQGQRRRRFQRGGHGGAHRAR